MQATHSARNSAWALARIKAALAYCRGPVMLGGSKAAPLQIKDPRPTIIPNPRLCVVLGGVCRHVVARQGMRQSFEGLPGESLFLAPHAWDLRLAGDATRFVGLVFTPGYLRILENNQPTGPKPQPAQDWYHTKHPLSAGGAQLIAALIHRTEHPPMRPDSAIDRDLVRALLRIATEHVATDQGMDAGPSMMQLLMELLHEHAADNLSRNGVARMLGIHPTYLSELCTRQFGIGFHAILEGIRVNRARVLLTKDETPLTVIAHACGWNDLRTFARAFRRVAGVTPGTFRRTL